MKLVYTVKPPQPDETKPEVEKFKRKARIVLCGNMAEADASEVYSGTAFIRAAREGWCVGVLDITSAFLQTLLEAVDDAPVVVATPPRILERQALVEPKMLWGITHAVYGLRQSPKLWGSYRDATVKQLVVELGGVPHRLQQGRVQNTGWVLKAEGVGKIEAILVIYVDDFMIVGKEETVHQLAATIRAVWKASEVQIAREGEPVRFLGMSIEVDAKGFALSQEDYLSESPEFTTLGANRGARCRCQRTLLLLP